ncbi:2-acylglycerol O-acyltransferase 2-B-like [Crotalus adamanteus]|uniref:2-acylglycerol O-acyltransferase 2-B-like n=1 Tax=Crotalus adamanteus TaxID=8729 RepID=A0AAW1BJD0_CROAD
MATVLQWVFPFLALGEDGMVPVTENLAESQPRGGYCYFLSAGAVCRQDQPEQHLLLCLPVWRHLQMAAILQWVFSFLALAQCCLGLYLVLLLRDGWLLVLGYAAWLYLDWETLSRGGRRSTWAIFQDYFPITLTLVPIFQEAATPPSPLTPPKLHAPLLLHGATVVAAGMHWLVYRFHVSISRPPFLPPCRSLDGSRVFGTLRAEARLEKPWPDGGVLACSS